VQDLGLLRHAGQHATDPQNKVWGVTEPLTEGVTEH
jgi:hypothetical protein